MPRVRGRTERDGKLPDGLALLRAIRDAARTPEGRYVLGELAVEVRTVLDSDDDANPVATEAMRLLERSRRRDGVRQPRARRRCERNPEP